MKLWIIGSAGVGKSTLVKLLKEKGYRAINLDPGAKVLPYKPDFDIREEIKVEDIMEELGIGPNMAFIEAYRRISGIKLPEEGVFDTPGQLDIFLLSGYGRKIMREGVGVFLVECRENVEELLMQLLLFVSTSLSLEIPLVYVFSKSDRCRKEFVMKVLRGKILPSGNMAEIFERIKIKELLPPQRQVFFSVEKKNVEDVIELAREALCACGDMS